MGKVSFTASRAVPLAYSAAVTASDTLTAEGIVERQVSAPAHLASFNPGAGAGLYKFDVRSALSGPRLLYPGVVAMSPPNTGGTISIQHAPWAAGRGDVTISYKVLLGEQVVSESLPYVALQAAGSVLRVMAKLTDDRGETEFEMGRVTIAENPLGPDLSGFLVDYATNSIRVSSNMAATGTWRRYPPGHKFVNQAAEVLAGTGAIDGGTFSIPAGQGTVSVPFTGGVSGAQELWIVARVGSGPLSDVVGGPINISIPGGLAAPQFRDSTFSGSGGSNVVSHDVILPPYNAGDTVILPIGIDCAVSRIAGITVSVSGETVVMKQGLTDNGVAGDDGQSVALYYYRAATGNPDGTKVATIAIASGGAKTSENIICAPNIRFSVKATGDPFAQVLKTTLDVAATSIATRALTAVSGQSRIEAFLVSEFEQPVGVPPETWTLREQGRSGPQSAQLVSRNAVTAAGQEIEAISLPLPVARRGVGLTWELLPLGA